MMIYLDSGAGCHVYHFSRNVRLQEAWAYTFGHAHRHESVWIVPGMAV